VLHQNCDAHTLLNNDKNITTACPLSLVHSISLALAACSAQLKTPHGQLTAATPTRVVCVNPVPRAVQLMHSMPQRSDLGLVASAPAESRVLSLDKGKRDAIGRGCQQGPQVCRLI
jgi:hypothetical protein